MTDRLETVVVVTDKGSQTFTKVGDSAQKMGTSIDKAATQGSTSLGRLNKAGAAAGVAFATLSGTLTLAAHANAEAQASHERLATAIDNTGHSLFEYQDQLDAAAKKALQLGFDDEDAADSVAKMTTATGNAQTAINDLSIAEDIARARKIDLASATNIVIAAEQGRTGALKRVGIEVDATMSKEQVMDALRAKFAGNAEAYSTTTAAGYDRLKNATENALEAIGAHLGPANQLLIVLPGLSAGFTGVGAAVGALAPELTASAVAATALDVALGPVGVALAAVAAGVALYELYQHLHNEATPGEKEAEQAAKELNATLREQLQIGSKLAPLTQEVSKSFDYIGNASKNYMAEVTRLNAQLNDLKQNHQDQMVVIGETADHIPVVESAWKNAEKQLDNYIHTQGRNKVSTEDLASAQQAANTIIRDSGPAAALAQDVLEKLFAAEQAGTLSTEKGETQWQAYLRQIIFLGQELPGMNANMIAAGVATETTAKKVAAFNDLLNLTHAAFDQMNVSAREYKNIQDTIAQQKADKTAEDAAKGFGHLESSMGAAITTQNTWLAGQYAAAAAAKSISSALVSGGATVVAHAQEQAKAFLDQANAIGFLDSGLKKLIAADSGGTWAERTSSRVQTATTRLDTLFSVIVDGTKNIGSQSKNLNDWAVDLINVAGSYGKIDDLLAHGQITLTTYNQAQEAGTRIIADNAAVQEDLLRIQAKQAPVLADAADAQAKYVDQLADMPAKQQEVALGWMDQNEAAKANAALNLAAAAAAGEYGDAGEQAASKAITAQAQADPAFAAMLTDMGVISQGANGEIVVNFPTASQVHDDTVNLTASIDALTSALGGIPPSVNTNITADYSSLAAGVNGAQAMLNTIDGRTVTTYVTTQYVGQTLPGQLGYQQGGVIPHAQHGMMGDGRTVIVGEAGPEIVKLPGGSLVTPSGASKEMMRGGGGNITIHVHGDIVADDPRAFAQKAVSLAYAGSRG
jgi:mannose/fructose/N-acetylgalactosamine-specific phosphotransferase system component IIB